MEATARWSWSSRSVELGRDAYRGALLRTRLSWGPGSAGSWMSPGSLRGLSGAWEAPGGPTFLSIQTHFLPQFSPRQTGRATSQTKPRFQAAEPHARDLCPPQLPATADSSIYYSFHWLISSALLYQPHSGQSNVKPRGLSSTAGGEPRPLERQPGGRGVVGQSLWPQSSFQIPPSWPTATL